MTDEQRISIQVRKDFWKMINRLGEEQNDVDVNVVVDFLNTMLRSMKNPPTLEVISVLRHEKPLLIERIRRSFPKDHHIHQLSRMEISYEIAKERLEV